MSWPQNMFQRSRPRLLRLLRLLLLPAACWPAATIAEEVRVHTYQIRYSDDPAPYVLGLWTVPDDFINTGLAYDPENHLLFCSHLDFSMQGECIETLRRSDGRREADPVRVNPYTALIQGLTFDPDDRSLWVWGGDVPYEDKYAAHFAAAGEFLGSFLLPGYPGSLEFDAARGLILAKAMDDGWVRFYTPAGEEIERFYSGHGGEGLALDPFDDTFWVLTESRLFHIRRAGSDYEPLGDYPNPTRYFPPDTLAGYWEDGEAEGLIVDPSDRTIWLNADQNCHGGIPDGNRCWHINPLGTYDQSVLIPGGLVWRRGLHLHTIVAYGSLRIEPGYSTGQFLTPVIDFLDRWPQSDSLFWTGDGGARLDYRASDVPPTTAPLDHLTLPYYDANQPNAGWGETIPGPWQTALPSCRFVQARMTLSTGSGAIAEDGGRGEDGSHGSAVALTVWPNPVGERTLVQGRAPEPGRVKVVILDIQGRCVLDLAVRAAAAPRGGGEFALSWDGRDAHGARLPPGVYWVRASSARVGTGIRLLLSR